MRQEKSASATGGHPRRISGHLRPPEFRQEIEEVLNALRQWIVEFEEWEEAAGDGGELPEVDLHSVVSELVALRGEVHLESKGAKASRERMEEAAEAFGSGLEFARREIGVSLTEGLVPLVRERDRLRDDLEKAREEPLDRSVEALLDSLEALRRGSRAVEEARRRLGWRRLLLPRGLLGALLEGYRLATGRIERQLSGLGISEIAADGVAFDPVAMRAVETEVREDVSPGCVLEVLRPGYRRGERVVRAAEVRTAVAAPGLSEKAARTAKEVHERSSR